MTDNTRTKHAAAHVVNGATRVAPVLRKVPDTKTAVLLRQHIASAQADAARTEAQRKRKMHIHGCIVVVGCTLFLVIHLGALAPLISMAPLLPDMVPWATTFIQEIIDRVLGI